MATPLCTHDRQRDGSLIDMVERLCVEHEVTEVVVGHALTQTGESGESAARGERVAALLVDERYSTAEAQRLLAGRKRERGHRDAVAAALILQSLLDARRS